MRKPLSLALVAALTAALAAGCGADPEPAKSDAGTATDTGTSADGVGADGAGSDATGTDATGTDATGTDATSGDAGPTDATTADAGTPPKYATCIDVGDCVAKACAKNEKDCEKACLSDASEAALQEAAPLLSCYKAKCIEGACKDSTEPGCANDCIGAMCTADFVKCIDSPADGKSSCGTAFDCFDKCDVATGAGFACFGKCVDALTKDDVTLLKDVGACIGKHPGEEPDKSCGKELYACMLGATHGDKACGTIFSCAEDCEKAGGKDDACMMQCAPTLTKEAKAAFAEMMPCLGDDTAMKTPQCQKALKGCIAPSGSDSCTKTFGCASKCPDDKGPACMFDCLASTDSKSYDTFMTIAACMPDEATPVNAPGGATPTDDGPDLTTCYTAMVTCAEPSGTEACPKTLSCVQTCMDNQKTDNPLNCIFACAATGSAAGFADAVAFGVCNETCGDKCDGDSDLDKCKGTCLQATCPDALKKCTST